MTADRFAAYRSFVESAPHSDDAYLFDRPETRFWPEPGDELVAPPVTVRVCTVDEHLDPQRARHLDNLAHRKDLTGEIGDVGHLDHPGARGDRLAKDLDQCVLRRRWHRK
jgi:hypothetical protein